MVITFSRIGDNIVMRDSKSGATAYINEDDLRQPEYQLQTMPVNTEAMKREGWNFTAYPVGNPEGVGLVASKGDRTLHGTFRLDGFYTGDQELYDRLTAPEGGWLSMLGIPPHRSRLLDDLEDYEK